MFKSIITILCQEDQGGGGYPNDNLIKLKKKIETEFTSYENNKIHTGIYQSRINVTRRKNDYMYMFLLFQRTILIPEIMIWKKHVQFRQGLVQSFGIIFPFLPI